MVLLAAGLVTWLLWPSSSPSLTYQGKSISDASGVLTGAETDRGLDRQVRGTASRAATPAATTPRRPNPPKGTKKSDVQNTLYCGPVLFVDGDTAAEYLKVPVSSTGTSGGNAKLAAQKDVSTLQPVAVGSDVNLARPDGKTPPAGNGGLSVPEAAAADKNSVVADLARVHAGTGQAEPGVDGGLGTQGHAARCRGDRALRHAATTPARRRPVRSCSPSSSSTASAP